MPLFQVRNRRTKMVLGEVEVDDPTAVLDELAASTGTTVEEIAQSLGATIEEAKAALDIAVIRVPLVLRLSNRPRRGALPPRRLFAHNQ